MARAQRRNETAHIPSNGSSAERLLGSNRAQMGKKLPFSACNRATTKPRIYVYIIDMICENVEETKPNLAVCATAPTVLASPRKPLAIEADSRTFARSLVPHTKSQYAYNTHT